MPAPPPEHRADTALVVVAAAVLYGMTTANAPQEADAGEFVTLALAGGVAHPPGYPLYLGLLRMLAPLTTLVPAVPLFSLVSGVCVAAAAGVLHRVLGAAHGHRAASAAA